MSSTDPMNYFIMSWFNPQVWSAVAKGNMAKAKDVGNINIHDNVINTVVPQLDQNNVGHITKYINLVNETLGKNQ
jgi:hypothetical protein